MASSPQPKVTLRRYSQRSTDRWLGDERRATGDTHAAKSTIPVFYFYLCCCLDNNFLFDLLLNGMINKVK